jgi:imidazolonepropionase-like amidohydrolase
MRMPDELGQVKAGFLADIILIDGDPLQDITILQDQSRIVGIMKNGVFHKDPGDGTHSRARDLDEIHRGTPVPA